MGTKEMRGTKGVNGLKNNRGTKEIKETRDMKEMTTAAIHDLLHYSRHSPLWHLKQAVKTVTGRQAEPIDLINWPTGLLANGLFAYYKNHLNSEESLLIMRALKKYYDRWITGGHKIYYMDDILCGTTLIELEQMTGDERYKQALDIMVKYLYQHEVDMEGVLPYRPKQKNNHIYADSIGMICPFLCKYGVVYEDQNAINLAVKQIKSFISHGCDARTGLPYHGYECKSRVKYGIIGWGRAVGWLMMGMVDSLIYMDKGSVAYDTVKQAFRHVVDKVEAYQLENGMYAWQLAAKEGPVDTSATAMILFAIARGLEHEILIGIHRSRMMRGREALAEAVKNGRIYDCLAECGGFSIYPQIYDTFPWSLGPALSLFMEVEDNQKQNLNY